MRPLEFIILRGEAWPSEPSVAREVASRLPPKAAVVALADLRERWIVTRDPDAAAEATMVYRQVRLLASGYLRAGYHVVVDALGPANPAAKGADAEELAALRSLMATIPDVRVSSFALAAADSTPPGNPVGDPVSPRSGGDIVIEAASIGADVVAARVLLELGLPGM